MEQRCFLKKIINFKNKKWNLPLTEVVSTDASKTGIITETKGVESPWAILTIVSSDFVGRLSSRDPGEFSSSSEILRIFISFESSSLSKRMARANLLLANENFLVTNCFSEIRI